jgi:hypothetical protein
MNGSELTALQKAGDEFDQAKAVENGVAPKMFPMVGMTQTDFADYGEHITLKDVIPPNCRILASDVESPDTNQPSEPEPAQPSSSTPVKQSTSTPV